MNWNKQQQNHTTTVQIAQGIRLWFMPGVAELLIELIPEPGEARFGLDIKRTEEVRRNSAIRTHVTYVQV